jgi:acyl-CoA synthetase (AMP-forming)/AMP-acid ligase II
MLSRLERDPGGRAIAFLDNRLEYQWSTVAEFWGEASRCATFLSDAGLKKGGVCIIVLSSGETAAKTVLACVLMGAVPLLIAPPSLQTAGAFSSLGQIIRGVILKTGPQLVVLDDALLAIAQDFATNDAFSPRVIAAGDIKPGRTGWHLLEPAGERDIVALQLTSGTTGFPKVCSWEQARVVAALEGMAEAMRLTPADVCLNWTPLYHDMGLVNNFFTCLALGVPLGMIGPQDFVKNPSLWLRGLAAIGATATWSPNFGFAITAQRCKDADVAGLDLSHVRGFWSAAERIHHETMVAFYERFRSRGVRWEALKTNFGCAENVGGATFSDPDGAYASERVDRVALFEHGVAQPVAETTEAAASMVVVGSGKGHPQLKVRILDEDGALLPDGHVGEVALDSPSRMSGYLGDAEASERALDGGLLRTGDLGYVRDGELFWVGRVRERINVRGVKLDPSDFESILLKIAGLRPGCFAAFGVDDSRKGTQKVVVVTEVRGTVDRSGDDIADRIRSEVFTTLGLNVDDVVLVREGTLTKTSSGKRRHQFVKELYESGRLAGHQWLPSVQAAG